MSEKEENNLHSKTNVPDSGVLWNDDELAPYCSVCGLSEWGQGHKPGLVYVGARATQASCQVGFE